MYLPGLVTAVYAGDKDTPESNRDTADVSIISGGTSIPFKNCPIFYHCDSSGVVRENGSIENSSRAFTEGDEALCRCHVKPKKDSVDENPSFDKVFLVGHVSGPKRCSYKYAFLRISEKELKELKSPLGEWEYSESSKKYVYKAFDKDSHKDEMCIVYDAVNKKLADVIDPTKDGTKKYVFPCSVESLKPFLDSVNLELDRELYKWSYHGSAPDTIEFASAYPNHTDDFSGEHLGVSPTGVPYTSYFDDDPALSVFVKFTNAVTRTTSSELSSGKFERFDELKKSKEEIVAEFASRSKGFLVDTREKEVTGTVLSDGSKPQYILDAISRLTEKRTEYLASSKLLAASRAEAVALIASLESGIRSGQAKIDVLVSEFNAIASLENGSAYDLARQIADLKSSLDSSLSVLARKREDLVAIDASISEMNDKISNITDEINNLNNFDAIIQPAISPKGERLKNTSFHVQALYGENENWLCAKNTYMGFIVSYCDSPYKFIRVQKIPGVLPIPFTVSFIPSAQPMYYAALLSNAGLSFGNNIWDYVMLKRFNEGCFHRTTAPAVCGVSGAKSSDSPTGASVKDFNGVGSYRLDQIAHEERDGDPLFATAVNSRLEHIDSWYRKDNWMNSIELVGRTPIADATAFFISFAVQWRLSCVYIDTPIGSMLYGSPRLQAATWYMYQIHSQGSTARNDLPFRTHFIAKTRQTGAAAMQIYIVQRQSLTAWNEGVDKKEIVRQVFRYGPYDCHNVASKFPPGAEPPAPNIKELVPSDATYSGDFKPGGGSFGGGGASGSWDGGGLSESDEAPPASGAVGATDTFEWKDDEKVRFVRRDNKLVDFLSLSDTDKAALVEDRFFVISDTDVSSRGAYPLSRNEIEIMASFDTFPALKTANKTNDASKAIRSKAFEEAIRDFIKKFYDDVVDKSSIAVKNKTFSMFYFDAKII